MRTGTLVDATLIPSASIRHDCEARWAGHRRRKPLHGDTAHVATDQDAWLIHGVEVTTANVHDAAALAEFAGQLDGIDAGGGGRSYESDRIHDLLQRARERVRVRRRCARTYAHTPVDDAHGMPRTRTRM